MQGCVYVGRCMWVGGQVGRGGVGVGAGKAQMLLIMGLG